MKSIQDQTLIRSQCLIDGRWVEAADGTIIAVTDPADGRVIGRVPRLDAQGVQQAIDAAAAAWPAWRRRSAKDRAVVLRRWFEAIMGHQEDLARLMTAEQGKPLAEARAEIAYAASFVEWFAEEGKRLMADCAATVKKISLELGGKAPFIVMDDADLDAAVAGAMISKYRKSGQTCVCTNRFLVQDGIYDAFTRRLAEASAGLKLGRGMEDGVDQGPLIDRDALEKVETLIAQATAGGARVITGGMRHALGGTFFVPTVLVEVKPEMAVVREEIFGPASA